MAESPRFVLVTGLSGAGKSQTLRFLEDLGYYCIDNLPPALIPTIADLALNAGRLRRRIAVCVDVRGGDDLLNLPAYLDDAAERGLRPETLFLESADAVLVRRYSESRRKHPATPDGTVEEGIQRERALLAPIRTRATLVLDTSTTSIGQLRERVAAVFAEERRTQAMLVGVMSFGFKFGVPQEADVVLDVRFLPNPFYDSELRALSGEDPRVASFVIDNEDGQEFLSRTRDMLAFLLPKYAAEPKSYLTIAVGCTGGRHRSVAVARVLSSYIQELQWPVTLRHRDVARVADSGAHA
ncbi:MAG TPA: RNase adapter RapZ [Candidatus Hydrogenedentes bacterium]|nr:RNase adapter RapZ [Candidatus Hydrogenedentota bacterium]HRK34827.1 RNase adapter RapZ [Candidatus Hydrogenedentota bacterium]